MTFKEYQQQAIKCAQYPNKGSNIIYPLLGLIGETGEVSEKIKKMIRDDNNILTDKRKEAIQKELGDVLWYTQAVCYEIGVTPENLDLGYIPYMRNVTLQSQVFRLVHNVSDLCKECRSEKPNQEKIFIYVIYIVTAMHYMSDQIGVKLNDVAQQNLDKLFDRLDRGVIKGDGDNR